MLQLSNSLKAEEEKLRACVHCGLCLEACPTYVHTGDENDSPRGRLYLMRAVEEERLAVDSPAFARHIDRCLGCRACESACPAGVEYGTLLEAARSDIAAQGRRQGWTGRLLRLVLRHVWLHPARLSFAFALARVARDSGLSRLLFRTRLFSPRIGFALALLEASTPALRRGRRGADEMEKMCDESSTPRSRPNVAALFTGCVTEGLFARVNRATARVLKANNCETRAPRGQVCCGALHAHAGDLEGARALARRNVAAFSENLVAPVVTNSGGCGAMLLSYAHLLKDDEQYRERAAQFSERVRDISQQLEATGTREGAETGAGRTTYDASCHLLHGQHAARAPLAMLATIPGLEYAPLEESDVCCGGAGVYNLLEAELSARVLDEKLAHVRETGAQILVTGNPGCHMQIAAGARCAGMDLKVCHPIELLDESYRRAGFYGSEDE